MNTYRIVKLDYNGFTLYQLQVRVKKFSFTKFRYIDTDDWEPMYDWDIDTFIQSESVEVVKTQMDNLIKRHLIKTGKPVKITVL